MDSLNKNDNQFNVLVVDDETPILCLIRDFLEEKGFNVFCATSGNEAVNVIAAENISIVILDLYLPDIRGNKLLNIIKSANPLIHVIMITGYGTIQDAVECMKIGASDFITKPVYPDHIYMTITRILKEEKLKEEAKIADYFRTLSKIDELTGLYNHRYFMSMIKRETERHLRYNHQLSVAFIDIDDFKRINDISGHEAGNVVLARFASILKQNTRGTDIVARYGGEEFIVIFPETSPDDSSSVSRRFCSAATVDLGITATVGIACLPSNTSNCDELIEMADKAMYWGKQNGKNKIVVYDEGVNLTSI